MRTIRHTTQFKRDYKREAKGRHGKTIERDLRAVVSLSISDARLPAKYRDHPLAGERSSYSESRFLWPSANWPEKLPHNAQHLI